MHQTAAFLDDHVLPNVALRQWVLAPPFALVGLLAARHDILTHMNRIFIDAVFRWLRADSGAGAGVHRVHCGAVTFIQRFSGSLLVFPHLHVIALDGVYAPSDAQDLPRFIPTSAPSDNDTRDVADQVARRMARLVERLGLLDAAGSTDPTPLCRWYAGVHREPAGLARVEASGAIEVDPPQPRLADSAHGFSVHARIHVQKGDQAGRERLLCYAARPPWADAQLSETADGRIAVALRKSRPGGQTHVVLEPLRLPPLAWLIPLPRRHQIRFHGVLAPAASLRKKIVPTLTAATPAPESSVSASAHDDHRRPKPKNAASISWAQLLRRTYDIDAECCEKCGERLRPVAVILDPEIARKILVHLELPTEPPRFFPRPSAPFGPEGLRAPP